MRSREDFRIDIRKFPVADRYHVRISKDYLVFSAGHFITYNGDVCERLHGHNYRVTAEVHGWLDENQYVVDFILLRDTLKAIVDELDHHMLLPTRHPLIRVVADDREVEATFRDRRWVFPRCDCVLLPLANTTSELLAHYIADRLARDLDQSIGKRPRQIRIEVDECFGNVAVCELGPAEST
ncbi:MAG: 6-pyruvoyl tetrahydropterin synthase family protein [Planctomycetia bacterium]|nr:6-pyruvoyl tetrahydropterin synthase family protein [Planctomycetia bacterium]